MPPALVPAVVELCHHVVELREHRRREDRPALKVGPEPAGLDQLSTVVRVLLRRTTQWGPLSQWWRCGRVAYYPSRSGVCGAGMGGDTHVLVAVAKHLDYALLKELHVGLSNVLNDRVGQIEEWQGRLALRGLQSAQIEAREQR